MNNKVQKSDNLENTNPGVNVSVNVDAEKIVKYLCITGVLIVSIVFVSKLLRAFLDRDETLSL